MDSLLEWTCVGCIFGVGVYIYAQVKAVRQSDRSDVGAIFTCGFCAIVFACIWIICFVFYNYILDYLFYYAAVLLTIAFIIYQWDYFCNKIAHFKYWRNMRQKYPESLHHSYPPSDGFSIIPIYPHYASAESLGCHLFALSTFYMFTGIHWSFAEAARSYSGTTFKVNPGANSNLALVYYIDFEWRRVDNYSQKESLYSHSLVCCNNYIYQSYKTKVRHKITVGYPPIMIHVPERYRTLFTHEGNPNHRFSKEVFNKLCAPCDAQLDERVTGFRISTFLNSPLYLGEKINITFE